MTDAQTIDRLLAAAADYDEPTAEQLAAVPLIEDWGTFDEWDALTPPDLAMPAVHGDIYGHPVLEDGSFCMIAECQALADDWTWMMTKTGLYRLGRPGWMGDEDV